MAEVERLKKRYVKDGYEVTKREATPSGERFTLRKQGRALAGLSLTTDKWALVEHLRRPTVTLDDLAAFARNFEDFYEKHEQDEVVAGHLMVQGNYDKKSFGYFIDKLPKAVRKRIELGSVKGPVQRLEKKEEAVVTQRTAAVEEKHIKEKVTEREITIRTKVSVGRIDIEKVCELIEATEFARVSEEKGYETQLFQALRTSGYHAVYESEQRGARFDLVLGKDEVAIELKIIRSPTAFNALIGQITRYKRQFDRIIIVIIDRLGKPSLMEQEIQSLRKIDQRNIRVIRKT